MQTRLNYEESCRSLQNQGWLQQGDIPPLPTKPPAYDDEILGVEFFRTWLNGKEGADFQNLTLTRTYFSRSQISDISFFNTDLSESVANWNDFEDVDFSSADMSRFDLRACRVLRTKFVGALLKDADLRCCYFEQCDFSNADLTGAKILREMSIMLNLSAGQNAVVDWQDEDGEEPAGG
jgi:uncharacterized protein YjbI with pentapeptide repeats